MNRREEIVELIKKLNKARYEYYNNSNLIISDYEYDKLYDELEKLENETKLIYSNSPTQTVGYPVHNSLSKVQHKYPMLSLSKTKKSEDLIKFLNGKDGLLMFKCDGLTTCLTYDENGDLIQAETRGDGVTGTLCTDNVKTFNNVPLHINHKGTLIVYGESIVKRKEFEEINCRLSDNDKFKTQRNMASGALLQLDSKVCADRNLSFIAWRLVEGSDSDSFKERLRELSSYGFEVVNWINFCNDIEELEHDIFTSKDAAEIKGIPIDGLVVGHDSISYGNSLGSTSHHRRAEIAFKFGEDRAETRLIDVDFTMGKTGLLTPVLHFKPVELMDTTVEYASVHNLSILKKLGIKKYCNVVIVKKNDIIPQCIKAYGGEEDIVIPKTCPICGGVTIVVKDNDTEILRCDNPECKGKLLGKLTHYVSKYALNIDGFSEATIEKFMELGWLTNLSDIYTLHEHNNEMMVTDGFGKKSTEKLLAAIEKSKTTTLERYLYGLSIPLIGRAASKAISKYFKGDYVKFIEALEDRFDFSLLEDFGSTMKKSVYDWYKKYSDTEDAYIPRLLEFDIPKVGSSADNMAELTGKVFVITGSLLHYANRNELVAEIEGLGGKVSGSVSAKTNYLINNDSMSTSGKNKKAHELNIPIITEEEFLKLIGK